LAAVLGLPAQAEAEWSFGAFLGNAWTRPSAVHLAIPDLQTDLHIAPVEYRSESFQSPVYYGGRAAWTPRPTSHLGVEAEFIHMKVFARTDRLARVRGTWRGVPVDDVMPVGAVIQRLAMSHGLNILMANAAFRHDIRKHLSAAVRAGVGATVPHVETTLDGFSKDHYAGGGLASQVAGGVEAELVPHLRAIAEYKFTWTSPTIDVASGTATVPARSHHLVAGLGYRF
jgi:opacity protein-like surface antigen